jgi:hypothetical protein
VISHCLNRSNSPVTTARRTGRSGGRVRASVSRTRRDAGWRPELSECEDRQGPRLLTVAPWCCRPLPLAAGFKHKTRSRRRQRGILERAASPQRRDCPPGSSGPGRPARRRRRTHVQSDPAAIP